MRNPLKRLVASQLDYTTRVHLKRRASSIDYKFMAAMAGLAAAVVVVVRAI